LVVTDFLIRRNCWVSNCSLYCWLVARAGREATHSLSFGLSRSSKFLSYCVHVADQLTPQISSLSPGSWDISVVNIESIVLNLEISDRGFCNSFLLECKICSNKIDPLPMIVFSSFSRYPPHNFRSTLQSCFTLHYISNLAIPPPNNHNLND
jgi:hypothetical protein